MDKVVHAGIFLVLAILWRRVDWSRRAIGAVILGGFALGAMSELGQLLPIVRRNASLYDLATDCAGLIVGVAIAPLVEPFIRSMIDAGRLGHASLLHHRQPESSSDLSAGGLLVIARRSVSLLAFAAVSSLFLGQSVLRPAAAGPGRELTLSWDKEILTIRGGHLPGGALEILYIEAFCRPGSTARDWTKTVIPHKTELVAIAANGRSIKLRSRLEDGVVVDHEIRAGGDEVDFQLVASNPTSSKSLAHWAQPCIRVNRYAGTKLERNSETYLPYCFLYVDGKAARMPIDPWARKALYTPGQVWCPPGVSRDDVNPRPLSSVIPSNGLIGCVSADGKELIATAWEPYQELFQGVIVCLHSDFRIGGLLPGQTKTIRGKIYLMPADFQALPCQVSPGHSRPGS